MQEYWHDMKFWWPHNEAIIATLLAYQLTGDSDTRHGTHKYTTGPTTIFPIGNMANGTATYIAMVASACRSKATSGKGLSTCPACSWSAGSCWRR